MGKGGPGHLSRRGVAKPPLGVANGAYRCAAEAAYLRGMEPWSRRDTVLLALGLLLAALFIFTTFERARHGPHWADPHWPGQEPGLPPGRG